MGVDSKAIIRPGTTLDEIVKHVEKKYGEVEVRNTHSDYFFNLDFSDGEDRRSLAVFFERMADRDYNIHGVLLSLGFWGNAVEILKDFCEEFGGYLDENDCDDKDFYPINIDKFFVGELTELDKFKLKLISVVGYDNLNNTLDLFEEYKDLEKIGHDS